MNINDLFWKWKRAIRKRREVIGRVISIVLIVLTVAFVGYVLYTTYQADLRREALANEEVDGTAIKANNRYKYGDPGFNKVAENDNLILSADYTTGEICVTEKATGTNWYSNPQNRENDEYVTLKNRLSAQFYVKFVNLDQGVTQEMDSYGHSVRKGGMRHQLIDNGIKFTFAFPIANVYIPVQYTLCDEGFKAEVVTSEIVGVGSNPFLVESISLLPFFGAGGLEDKGYLFIPDGSGALIEFNNEKQSRQVYNAQVYGKNPTLSKPKQETVRETAALPVFGAKCNDDAFFAIITNGDASSNIIATTSKKDSAYNHVYASAVLREYSLTQNKGDHLARKDSYSVDYSKEVMAGENYAVQYYFLHGEDASYTGMSNFYKDYLLKNNQLKSSELANKKYVVLDLVGAVSIEKYVVGIKRPVVTPLTTYNDVCNIVKELKAKGVENLVINYLGAMNGGLNNVVVDEIATESVLGSKKDFKNMISYLEQEGVILFMETNPVDIYNNGNGYKENKDSVKSFYDKYAFQYLYELDLGTSIETSRWHLLRPELMQETAESFAESLEKWNLKNVSYSRLGETIYSNYDAGHYLTRHQALQMWTQALKSADENVQYLMVHGGNAYVSAYADVITDVASTHSNFEMEDYSVPFYQMTFQDSTLITSTGINTTVDYDYSFLKALETGCSLKYNLIYGDVSQLVGTAYNTMVSYSYDYWKDLIAEQNKEMQDAAAKLAGKEIVGHEFLTSDVTLTAYEDAQVVINYGTEVYTYNGQEIAPRDYLILSGGAA